jgi:hypothetical protein
LATSPLTNKFLTEAQLRGQCATVVIGALYVDFAGRHRNSLEKSPGSRRRNEMERLSGSALACGAATTPA